MTISAIALAATLLIGNAADPAPADSADIVMRLRMRSASSHCGTITILNARYPTIEACMQNAQSQADLALEAMPESEGKMRWAGASCTSADALAVHPEEPREAPDWTSERRI